MIRCLLWLVLATVGLFSISGCNLFNRGGEDVAVEPQPSEDAVQGEGTELPSVPGGEEFSEPVVPGAPTSATVVAPDLIQSTNPNERAVGVQRSRPDPFASLPIPTTPPEPIVAPQPAGTSGGGGTQTASNQGGGGATPAAGNNAGGASASRPTTSGSGGATGGGTPVAVRPTPIAPLPAVPQPNTARAVRVSGVVQINGTPYAIVQAPNEVERYVRTGERIAGGQVLVKRIDTRSVEPRVVLEQNGIEVEQSVTGSSEFAAEPSPDELPEPPASQASLAVAPALSSLPAPGVY